jgi:hypothetical protein
MEYIVNSATEGIDFATYSEYLLTIREELPEHIYEFALDFRHYDLNANASLHDAWLESLTVRELASGSRGEVRRLEVKLCFLGPGGRGHLRASEWLAKRIFASSLALQRASPIQPPSDTD